MGTASLPITAEDVVRLYRTETSEAVRPALAEFVLANKSEIRSIARERLFSTTRSLCDTDELMGTVLRRLDRFVHEGLFAPSSGDDVWALIRTVAHHSAVTKVRLTQRARAIVKEDGRYAQMLLDRLNRCPGDDDAATLITRISLSIPDDMNRQLFTLRLRGTTHKLAAQLTGISETAARKRWSETMTFLQALVTDWDAP